MRGERVSHGLNSDIPVEIRNFRVYKPELPGFNAVLGKLQIIQEKSRVFGPPQSIRDETQRIWTILRIGQNISKVLIEFDF